MFFRCCSGTPLKRSALGQKKLAVLTRVFFHKKMYGDFCQAAKKSGRNDEVAVLQRGGRKAGGSTVTINSRTKLAHCRLVLWAVSIFLCAFRSCSKWILALILLQLELTVAKGTTFYLENLFKKFKKLRFTVALPLIFPCVIILIFCSNYLTEGAHSL